MTFFSVSAASASQPLVCMLPLDEKRQHEPFGRILWLIRPQSSMVINFPDMGRMDSTTRHRGYFPGCGLGLRASWRSATWCGKNEIWWCVTIYRNSMPSTLCETLQNPCPRSRNGYASGFVSRANKGKGQVNYII